MTKRVTENMNALDVRKLRRDGVLAPGRVSTVSWRRGASIVLRAEVGQVVLNYQARISTGEWAEQEYSVRLDWTDCNLGGRRAWFLCPASGCGRRVAILFGGSIFACRQCHKLAYACQSKGIGDRAMSRADTIRRRLGSHAGIAYPLSGKPKGMHWRTYYRLAMQYYEFSAVSLAETGKLLGLLGGGLDNLAARFCRGGGTAKPPVSNFAVRGD